MLVAYWDLEKKGLLFMWQCWQESKNENFELKWVPSDTSCKLCYGDPPNSNVWGWWCLGWSFSTCRTTQEPSWSFLKKEVQMERLVTIFLPKTQISLHQDHSVCYPLSGATHCHYETVAECHYHNHINIKVNLLLLAFINCIFHFLFNCYNAFNKSD